MNTGQMVCPFLTIASMSKDYGGFHNCIGKLCMAWSEENKSCKLIDKMDKSTW